MTTAKRQRPQRLIPIEGHVYTNAGGGQYVCTRSHDNSIDAWFMNIASGWELLAHGLIQYEDGTIEWDWSTDGRFSDGQLQKYREGRNDE